MNVRYLPRFIQRILIARIMHKHGGRTYEIEPRGFFFSIRCFTCGKTSYSQGDVRNLFCLNCSYHETNMRNLYVEKKNPYVG